VIALKGLGHEHRISPPHACQNMRPVAVMRPFGGPPTGYAASSSTSISETLMSAPDVRHEERTDGADSRTRTGRVSLNWTLALLTIPGAAAVVVYSYLQVLSTAGCTGAPCSRQGPGEFIFGLIMYGTPVVAAVAVALSFVTARRAHGIVVPAIAWTLLVIATVILATTFQT